METPIIQCVHTVYKRFLGYRTGRKLSWVNTFVNWQILRETYTRMFVAKTLYVFTVVYMCNTCIYIHKDTNIYSRKGL